MTTGMMLRGAWCAVALTLLGSLDLDASSAGAIWGFSLHFAVSALCVWRFDGEAWKNLPNPSKGRASKEVKIDD